MSEGQPVIRKSYPSDTTDEEWELVELLFPEPVWEPGLTNPLHPNRVIFDAIRYRIRTGIAWRSLPHDFPPWSTVMKRFLRWRDEGVLETVHDVLRDAVRIGEGRQVEPTAGMLDSQSVKSTDVGGPKGFDAGKKSQGTQAASAGGRARAALGAAHHPGRCARPGRRGPDGARSSS